VNGVYLGMGPILLCAPDPLLPYLNRLLTKQMRLRAIGDYDYVISKPDLTPHYQFDYLGVKLDRLGTSHRDRATLSGHRDARGSVGWMLALLWGWHVDVTIAWKPHTHIASNVILKQLAAEFEMSTDEVVSDIPTVGEFAVAVLVASRVHCLRDERTVVLD
jgi:hypothetical protein